MNNYLRSGLAVLGLTAASAAAQTATAPTQLISQPDISDQHIAFVYGGDIWLTDRNGANPRQLTSHPASESKPLFSSDGQWLAFSADYHGNQDVYIVSLAGGTPQRLTYHPADDLVTDWSSDGASVYFTSDREVLNTRSQQLFSVATSGGLPQKYMEAVVAEGKFAADGKRLAYRPNRLPNNSTAGWRLHRGGSTPPIWILDKDAESFEQLPRANASHHHPFWLKDALYLLSDRDDVATNLYRYADGQLTQLTQFIEWDITHANGHDSTIVFTAGGYLYRSDLAGTPEQLPVKLAAPAPQTEPDWHDASKLVSAMELSHSGKRVLLTARGDVFSVPAEFGPTRNLTRTDGKREYTALWHPKTNQVAYLSDYDMRQHLVTAPQDGIGEPTSVTLPGSHYYQLLEWSPDGRWLALNDNHLNLYLFDTQAGALRKIHRAQRRWDFTVSFSPDSQYLAFSTMRANAFSSLHLYAIESEEVIDLTEGMSFASNPVFTNDYLFFTASVNAGPAVNGLDLSTQERPVRMGIYAFSLTTTTPSPVPPRLSEDIPPADNKEGEEPAAEFKIDLEGLSQRISALPVSEQFYHSLRVAADGSLYYLLQPQDGISTPAQPQNQMTLMRFDFESRKATQVAADISSYDLSGDGKQLLTFAAPDNLTIGPAAEKFEGKPVALNQVRSFIDPRKEWRQIFDDVWRMQKEYFYAENMHGLDWHRIYAKYLPMLPHVQTRSDLNQVLVAMISELQVGHNNVGGGDIYRGEPDAVGLLGADFKLRDNRYQIAKIYTGDRWSPELQAPLAVPGLDAAEGDFILAVNGRELSAADNLHSFLVGTAGQAVTLTVADNAEGDNRRQVSVVTSKDDGDLRTWSWIKDKQNYVEKASQGQLAYVYLPNTTDAGYYFFNRMFFPQAEKPALIIDERRNGGGQAANYITEILARPHLSSWYERDGSVWTTPGAAIHGPKTMLIDQDAGSGGDFLPWAFSYLDLGTTVGTRTWGGLIGISANPSLIDGGFHTVPFFRFFTPEREWAVENEGVAPDIEVILNPVAVNQGRDPQLERAVEETLRQLRAAPPRDYKTPPPLPDELGI
ncbi:S41 family peptidase [Pseudidiomarina insulisalsae]|uniref:Tricorn protease homolog n=1 Tax=Pseudidiomarina insulisalsae TaxID=575789 RepID=A0A432YM83_9GAMM|nr:S41 family peptidase [Pseudidiomarina insulisalsae]RUO62099.1 peptidase S41 [Pseudidiomarina insulisalsae]